jgi:ribosomal protein S18 acetylase RimI-like enzyme
MTEAKTQISIRQAVPRDAGHIWAILEPVFRAGDTYAMPRDISRKDGLAYWVGAPHVAYVAELDGATVGTYYLGPNQQGGGAHVCNCGFATDPGARGRGVARHMLEHALRAARAAGFRAMQFNFVVATNSRAIRTWKQYGFAEVGRIPDAFLHPDDGYVDALVMYKRL